MSKLEKILIKKHGKEKAAQVLKILSSKTEEKKVKETKIDYKLENEKLQKQLKELKEENEFVEEMENFEPKTEEKDSIELEDAVLNAEKILNTI